MRIRTVKPEFWTNERMAALPESSQLMVLALLNYCDDHGFLLASPAVIRGALFPFHEDYLRVKRGLSDLESIDYLRVRAGPDGRAYGWIVHFSQHQRVDKKQKSKIEGICDFALCNEIPITVASAPVSFDTNLGTFPSGMEGNGMEVERNRSEYASCPEAKTASPRVPKKKESEQCGFQETNQTQTTPASSTYSTKQKT